MQPWRRPRNPEEKKVREGRAVGAEAPWPLPARLLLQFQDGQNREMIGGVTPVLAAHDGLRLQRLHRTPVKDPVDAHAFG